VFLSAASAYLADDHQTGMDADAYRQSSVLVLRQLGIQRVHRLEDAQSGPHGPLRIILMRPGIAKIDQQPIAEILRNIPVIALNHRGAGLLIGPHHVAPLFRIQLAGEHG
jgi:hypothetical protein